MCDHRNIPWSCLIADKLVSITDIEDRGTDDCVSTDEMLTYCTVMQKVKFESKSYKKTNDKKMQETLPAKFYILFRPRCAELGRPISTDGPINYTSRQLVQTIWIILFDLFISTIDDI